MQNGGDVLMMQDLFGSGNSPTDQQPLSEGPFPKEAVLLTCAGGTLGRSLASRLADLPLKCLFLLDTSEHGLAALEEDRHNQFGEASEEQLGPRAPLPLLHFKTRSPVRCSLLKRPVERPHVFRKRK